MTPPAMAPAFGPELPPPDEPLELGEDPILMHLVTAHALHPPLIWTQSSSVAHDGHGGGFAGQLTHLRKRAGVMESTPTIMPLAYVAKEERRAPSKDSVGTDHNDQGHRNPCLLLIARSGHEGGYIGLNPQKTERNTKTEESMKGLTSKGRVNECNAHKGLLCILLCFGRGECDRWT